MTGRGVSREFCGEKVIKSSHKKLEVPHAVIQRERMSSSTTQAVTVKLSPILLTAMHVVSSREPICARTSINGDESVNVSEAPS